MRVVKFLSTFDSSVLLWRYPPCGATSLSFPPSPQLWSQAFLRTNDYTRPQSLVGALSQMNAALFHYVSPARLLAINASIPKIAILSGDDDYLVDPSNSKHLSEAMPSAEYVVFEKTGHAILSQWPERMAKFLEGVFEEGWEKVVKQMDSVAPLELRLALPLDMSTSQYTR